ncbi:hypothetical protein RH449_003118 [Providencia stuartii]
MSNQHLEAVISELSARVTSQGIQIAELQKQLTDMQAKVSCELDASKSTIFSIQATIDANEKAFADTVSQLESRFASSLKK